jgi:hypothetical protein
VQFGITKNTKIDVEDGTGLVRVIVWHDQKDCSAALALCCACRGNNYICVIGEVRNYFDTKKTLEFDVCLVKSGNDEHSLTFWLGWKGCN